MRKAYVESNPFESSRVTDGMQASVQTVLSSVQSSRHAQPCKAVIVGTGETLGNFDRLLPDHHYYRRNLHHGCMEGVQVPSEQTASAQGHRNEGFRQRFGLRYVAQ